MNTSRDLRFCTNLRELYLRKNQIANVEDVRYLESMKDLRVLSLEENPCVTAPNYRLRVLQSLPHLVKLDSLPVTENEVRSTKLLFQLGNDDSDLPVQSSPASTQPSSVRSSRTQETTPRSRSLQSTPEEYGRSISFPSGHGVNPYAHFSPGSGEVRHGISRTPRSNSTLTKMPVAGAPVFRPQPPQTPPRPPQDPDFMNGGHTLDQHGLPEGSSTSPGVLYAVLTLLGELDVNALKVIKSDVENRLASVNP